MEADLHNGCDVAAANLVDAQGSIYMYLTLSPEERGVPPESEHQPGPGPRSAGCPPAGNPGPREMKMGKLGKGGDLPQALDLAQPAPSARCRQWLAGDLGR
jgi:hypothetical protein